MKEIVISNFKWDVFLKKFFEYLDVESNETVKTYYNGIKSFISYIGLNEQPKRDDVISWKLDLKEKTSVSTANTWLVGVKRFFKFLSLYRLYPNITEDIKGFKISQTPKKNVLTEEQIKKIYANLLKDESDLGIRNRALFSLLITTGLRGIEVSNARIEDLKQINGENCLFIKGKGHVDYDTYVKIPKNVLNNILEYIGDRKKGYIFISNSNHNKGEKITTKTIRYVIKEIFIKNGLNDETLSLHSTRRTFSCIAYNNGANIYEIQQVLRHASVTTTQRYLREADRYKNKTEQNVENILLG